MFNLEIKKTYNIRLLAPAIIGFSLDNALLMALMDYETAATFADVDSTHAAVYSSLPSGTPRAAKDLEYIKVKTTLGEMRILAIDWISEQPTLVTGQTIRADIGNVSPSDVATIKTILQHNGFTNLNISIL